MTLEALGILVAVVMGVMPGVMWLVWKVATISSKADTLEKRSESVVEYAHRTRHELVEKDQSLEVRIVRIEQNGCTKHH